VQVTQAARPGITIEAHQQVLIEALPPILVLHIKRFCYDTAVGGVVKVGKQVRFGPELEIGASTSLLFIFGEGSTDADALSFP
jgi:ubiquitin carboxyl-terminal hydrolase 10